MPQAEFELAIPVTKRPQTYALDRAATRTGVHLNATHYFYLLRLVKSAT
jgi:hypothetical protein